MANEFEVSDVQRIIRRAFFFPEKLQLTNWLLNTQIPQSAIGQITLPGVFTRNELIAIQRTADYMSFTGDAAIVLALVTGISNELDNITQSLGTQELQDLDNEIISGLNEMDALVASTPELLRPALEFSLTVPRAVLNTFRTVISPLVRLEDLRDIADTAVLGFVDEIENVDVWRDTLE